MAIINEKGTLSFKSEIQSGVSKAGTQWSNQTIVIDVPGYQGAIRKVAIKVSNREMSDVEKFPVGSKVEVGYQVKSREYNGRWYTDVDLYSIKADGETPAKAEPAQAPAAFTQPDFDATAHTEDLPF